MKNKNKPEATHSRTNLLHWLKHMPTGPSSDNPSSKANDVLHAFVEPIMIAESYSAIHAIKILYHLNNIGKRMDRSGDFQLLDDEKVLLSRLCETANKSALSSAKKTPPAEDNVIYIRDFMNKI